LYSDYANIVALKELARRGSLKAVEAKCQIQFISHHPVEGQDVWGFDY